MTNDAHQHRPEGLNDLGDVSVRPVPEIDGGAQDASTADQAHPADGADSARVQRVRAGVTRERVYGRGQVVRWNGPTGPRWYVYGPGEARSKRVKIGVFSDLGVAQAALAQFLEAVDSEDASVDVDGWVSDWCDAVPESRRRELAEDPRSPILMSWYRIGSPELSLEEIGRLLGISKERVRQLQERLLDLPRLRKGLAAYADMRGRWTHWDQLESMEA